MRGFVRAKWVLRGCDAGERLCALGDVHLDNAGTISFGSRVTFAGGMIPTSLVVRRNAALTIGDDTTINYGVRFEAHRRIEIGARCLLASMLLLCDKARNEFAPIRICDDCWIAHGAIIEPGVTIGCGAVVGAGAVVTKDVPPHSLALGNPARTMKLSAVG